MTKPIRHDDLVARPLGHNLDDFLLFVESQPPERCYDYEDSRVCACGQYNTAIQGSWLDLRPSQNSDFWEDANELASGEDLPNPSEWTFGALAARLREHLGR